MRDAGNSNTKYILKSLASYESNIFGTARLFDVIIYL